ncbi:MAG: hypothetical protein QOF30_2274 [Acidimicrobiaceae bacterium]|jgi:hypothetical protein|nr:hypothetical protein [Acidimicrobiaceae bacterium]
MGPKLLKIVVAIVTCCVPVLALAPPAHADGPSDIVTQVNNLRATVTAAPLATDATLTSAAQQWANHMASTGVLAHNPNLASQAPSGWTKIGENIGDAFSLTAVYNALVASPDHYANMVDKAFNRTGVGVATDTKGQVWLAEAFGAYPPPPVATFVFPTSGTVIFPSAQAFSWQQVAGAVYYCLTVGTTQGGVDLVNSGLLAANQLSFTVPALPGGQQLWARIYSYVQSTWTWADVRFSVTGPSTATFTRPLAGATNVDTTQPFTWAPVASASHYWLSIGTTLGGYELLNTGSLPATQTSDAVPALPAGRTLWARVYSYIAGSWVHYSDVSFTAAAR